MTTQNQNLRELSNTVEIVGTLKSKELQVRTSQAGNRYMSGNVIILSQFDGKVQEQKVKVFIMESSKLFKGIETVKNEYKTIDEHGSDNADRIRVTGELTLQEYYNRNGNLVSYNEVKGVFFNRLDPSNDQPDKAIASIETVVEGFEPILKDQLPTGDYSVKGFTVAWGNEVIELKKAVVSEELAEAFMNLYQPGSTGRLTFKLNNYVVTEKKEEEQVPTHGFGSTETIETVVNDYVNNIEIIGGDMPFFGTKEYTPEEIQAAKQVRALKLQELQQPAPQTPPVTNTGFGQGSPTGNTGASTSPFDVDNSMPFNMNKDAMPDF